MTTHDLLDRIARALEGQKTREVMNKEEAADYLRCSPSHLDLLRTTYRITCYRNCGRVIFRKKDLDRYLDSVAVTCADDDMGRRGARHE